LQVAPSAYRLHAARRRNPELRSARARRDEQLLGEIERVWRENWGVYGVRKVWHQLQREGQTVARCTVARLMKRLGIQGARRGRRVRTTLPEATQPCPLDRVKRQFRAQRPDQLWVVDFTYVSTWQGWLYVAFVTDAFARRIVGWQTATSMNTDFVLDALEQALHARQPPKGTLTHHGDRGSQYLSMRYSQRLSEAGVAASVGSVGDAYDNALAETINGLYKTEVIKRMGPWRSRQQLELATLRWVHWFNTGRLLESIGNIPPAEAEAKYWSSMAIQRASDEAFTLNL